MEMRKARPEDIAAVAEIYEDARRSLRERNIDQWQDGYPNADSAGADIENGSGYVIVEDGSVIGTACLLFGHEPTYDAIYEGQWKYEGEYCFFHRVAVSSRFKGKGVARMFMDELRRQAAERGVRIIRGDTHEDNISMQHAMEKNGLTKAGIILLEDGARRIAYEGLI